MTDPIDLEEVEVVGERLRRRTDPNVGIGQVVFSVWNGSGWIEFVPSDPLQLNGIFDGVIEIIEAPKMPTVRVAAGLNKSDPDYNRILEMTLKLAVKINQMDYAINNIGNNENMSFPNNNSMTGAEFKSLWYKMSYVVTTATYGPGRGGEVLINSSTGNATSYVNIQTIEGYESQAGEFGMNYYILHELSNTTPEALGFNIGQFKNTMTAQTVRIHLEQTIIPRLRA